MQLKEKLFKFGLSSLTVFLSQRTYVEMSTAFVSVYIGFTRFVVWYDVILDV